MAFQKHETTAYAKAQSGKGVAATVAGTDAIEITSESTLVKPQGNPVERTVLQPGKRLMKPKAIIGQWGDGMLGAEFHGSGVAGTAPEFGLALKNLLGTETTNAAGTVADAAATDTVFDTALAVVAGQAIRVEIGSDYEIRRVASVSGAGPYEVTVDRAFSQAPADGAIIAAGVSYYISEAGDATWLTVEQYEDGAKYLAVDARCRNWTMTVTPREVITQAFMFKSLTCTPSDASDGLTQTIDGQSPLVGVSNTLLIDGTSTNLKEFTVTADNPKEDSYINDSGLGDLPADSMLTITGTMQPEYTNVSNVTKFLNGTLADVELISGSTAGNIGFVKVLDLQYDGAPNTTEEEGDLIQDVSFTAHTGLLVAFF